MPQNMQQDAHNGLRGVLPALPVPDDQMSEADRTAYEAFRQAEQVKHQAAKEAQAVHQAQAQANAQAAREAQAQRKALAVHQAVPLDFNLMQARASQEIARRVIAETQESLVIEITNKILVGTDAKQLLIKYGAAAVARAQERSTCMKPTTQQAFTRARNRTNEAQRELGRALAANGVGTQHSVQDYTHVICTQLSLQLQGDNLPANEVLHKAFPYDSAKAISIGNSRRMSRAKKAYQSDQVKHHPVEKGTLALHGARVMQQRCSTRQFRQSLGIMQTLFGVYNEITSLKAGQVELRSRVATLEKQMSSTKCREALDDAGAMSSREKVIALDKDGMTPTQISVTLGMSLNTVKSHIRRHKYALKGAC